MYDPINNLPEYWKEWIENYELRVSNNLYTRLSASDFKNQVKITFVDGLSTANFYDALVVPNEQRNELAVFTEHCGYHIFSLGGTEYQIL